MAKPRVFVSSTYFDLKTVRADLDYFIREQGFDPILHERGSVPYGKQESLEHYCYREIENCDILISVIGGRFGSNSDDTTYSVSQTELRVALEQAKQVYVFVDRDVYHEYRTFERNKGAKIDWVFVDDTRIFTFLDEVFQLKNNNPVQPFETSSQITYHLKEQWAGLFQRLLSQQATDIQANMFVELKRSLETARTLVDVISSQADAKDQTVADLILTNHPLFAAVRAVMNVPYRLLFYDLNELSNWIEARGYRTFDDPFIDDEFQWIYTSADKSTTNTFGIKKSLFEPNGKLKALRSSEWSNDLISYSVKKAKKRPMPFDSDLDDDVPF